MIAAAGSLGPAARAIGNPAAASLDKTGFAPKRTLRRIGPPICRHVLWISGIIFKLVLESAEPRHAFLSGRHGLLSGLGTARGQRPFVRVSHHHPNTGPVPTLARHRLSLQARGSEFVSSGHGSVLRVLPLSTCAPEVSAAAPSTIARKIRSMWPRSSGARSRGGTRERLSNPPPLAPQSGEITRQAWPMPPGGLRVSISETACAHS